MAKAVRPAARSNPAPRPRPQPGGAGGRGGGIAPPRSTDRAGMVAYFQGVWEELRKVVWPARDELARMTGIVIATVVLFGVLIGGADYLLSLGVRQVYGTTSSSSAPATAAPSANGQPPHATPLP